MKYFINGLILTSFFSSCAMQAQDVKSAEAPTYTAEAPLPKGWPKPGPFNEVSEKTFPKYRAAFTKGSLQTITFWRLFSHIKERDIPMTAPVEMGVEVDGGKIKENSMAFLYQDTEVGQAGADGKTIRDVPEQKVLSYTWMGPDSKSNKETAKKAIDAELAKKKLKATSYRILGYNGSGVPNAKKTHELQAILEE